MDASDEFIRKVGEAAGQKLAVWMDEAPAAIEAFQADAGDAEFETDGTTVNAKEGSRFAHLHSDGVYHPFPLTHGHGESAAAMVFDFSKMKSSDGEHTLEEGLPQVNNPPKA